jgi:uncharacterized membrane protein YvbJ
MIELYCKHCGTELEDNSKFCHECGKIQETNGFVENEVLKMETKKNSVNVFWFIIAILLPIIGVLAGLIFIAQKKKNAVALLVLSIVAWGLFALLFFR